MAAEWMRWGLRSVANYLNRLAGPTEEGGEGVAGKEVEEEDESWGSDDEDAFRARNMPQIVVIPEVAYVVAAKDERADEFTRETALKYSLANLPTEEQVKEDLKKRTGLTNCEFYSCAPCTNPRQEGPFEIRWEPGYANLVKVVPV